MALVASISFYVKGLPRPQGSKIPGRTSTGHIFLREAAKGVKEWRNDVGWSAKKEVGQAGWGLFDGPVSMQATFYFPRPKCHFGTGRYVGMLKADAPVFVQTKPDIEKLVRAIADALTKIIYKDDCQVASLFATKRYSDETHPPGVNIVIIKL